MNFQETVDFLYSRLPYFSRDGKSAIKKDLHNTIKLCEILGNPQHKFKCIHIAGTNGKGSVSNMLAAILQNNGYRTGLYTSPHLKDFRERIRINGDMITESFVIEFTEKIIPYLDEIQPSFFEITVAMCFDYFAQNKIEIAVVETGLGGRLDSTNIIHPVISIITNIGMDHADLLGDTLGKIASEKAGIIKHNVPVVIGERQIETDQVFVDKAKAESAPIYFAEDNQELNASEIKTDLKGLYQSKNIKTVLQSVLTLNGVGIETKTELTLDALSRVREITNFRGRWEILSESPKIVADTGHNAHGLKWVVAQLAAERKGQLHMVFGMVKDKDRTEILKLLPKDAHYYFCSPALMRALDKETLKAEAEKEGLKGKTYESVQMALDAAKTQANSEDLIFIGGSTFVVAEIL
ncbi:MAG TPA: folylpolyglutamate synthase/dihydrofolate synthase family protein [Bacteroidia bacterium]